jgi:hypothetical protein
MGRKKHVDHPRAESVKVPPVRKPYTKPKLQRLGTVSELTQMGTPYTK